MEIIESAPQYILRPNPHIYPPAQAPVSPSSPTGPTSTYTRQLMPQCPLAPPTPNPDIYSPAWYILVGIARTKLIYMCTVSADTFAAACGLPLSKSIDIHRNYGIEWEV